MNAKFQAGLIILLLVIPGAQAFETKDEQIDHYLDILDSSDWAAKKTMLQRLQWSALSDPRLFDAIQQQLLEQIDDSSLSDQDYRLLSFQIRALGFSGNTEYRPALKKIEKGTSDPTIRRHAKKALREMSIYTELIQQVSSSTLEFEGQSVEVSNYMKMLSLPYPETKRFAARAIYHEKRREPELLEMAAGELRQINSRTRISKLEDDAGAWLCKALGESNQHEYIDMLASISATTSHSKIKRFSTIYAAKAPLSSSAAGTAINSSIGSDTQNKLHKVSGKYEYKVKGSPGDFSRYYRKGQVSLEQTGSKITGTFAKDGVIEGTLVGDTIKFDWYTSWLEGKGTLKIENNGKTMTGEWRRKRADQQGEWTMTRVE